MAIFKIKTQKREQFKDVFIGCYISKPAVRFMNLYKLLHCTTKSLVIRKAMVQWIDNNVENEVSLIQKIADTIQREWENQKIQDVKFSDFLKTVETELLINHITGKQIDNICKRIKK